MHTLYTLSISFLPKYTVNTHTNLYTYTLLTQKKIVSVTCISVIKYMQQLRNYWMSNKTFFRI